MNPYKADLFIYSGLYSLFANIVIGIFVYIRSPKSRINILFLFFSLCIAGWSVGSSLANMMENKQTALWVLRGNYLFAVWLPAIYVDFVCVLTGKQTKVAKYHYLVSGLLSMFVFLPLFIKKLKVIALTNFYISDPGPIYYLFFIFFTVSMLEVLFQTFNRLNFFVNKRQFQYIAIANCLAIFAGFEYFSRVFGFFKTPPFDDYVLIVYTLILAFAVVKYDVFNLEAIAQAFQREKLAAIGLLAASVNHEIKNPLYAAREQLNLHIENLKQGVPSKDYIQTSEKIKKQIDRALDVITKLNRFAKPTMDATFIDRKASIPGALQTVLDLVAYEFSLDKIKIHNRLPADLPQVQADQRQLEEILFNLIVNACHAMEGGGELTISANRHCEESRRDDEAISGRRLLRHYFGVPPRNDGFIQIIIQDTGHGISQDQMKHLFEPFHTTKGDKGTGLGLYITKQLVERNGGKIMVKSKEGQGTSFILEFRTV